MGHDENAASSDINNAAHSCDEVVNESDKQLQANLERLSARVKLSGSILFAFSLFVSTAVMMIMYGLFLLDLMATSPKVTNEYRSGPSPVPFFKCNSSVVDFYRGELETLVDQMGQSEINLVMFYAPWSFECLETKAHFELLSAFYGSQVSFYSINCWEPSGSCRKTRQQREYPMVEAYFYGLPGVQYEGTFSVDYMLKFVDHLITPFTSIGDCEELDNFLLMPKNRVIGYFTLNASSDTAYRTFYYTALKTLEVDPIRKAIEFAVVTNPDVARKVNLTSSGQVILFDGLSDNIGSVYPDQAMFRSDRLQEWIYESSRLSHSWFTPSTKRSNALQSILSKPTLLLFAPWQLLLEHSSIAWMIPQISRAYNDCDDGQKSTQLYNASCSTMANYETEALSAKDTHCSRHVSAIRLKTMATSKLSFTNEWPDGVRQNEQTFCQRPAIYSSDSSTSCPQNWNFERATADCSAVVVDPFFNDSTCRHWVLSSALNYSTSANAKRGRCLSSTISSLLGGRCQYGDMNFITIDSDHYQWYAKKLGVPVSQERSVQNAMIIDKARRSSFLLEEDVSVENLVTFILKYANGSLPKFYRTQSVKVRMSNREDSDTCSRQIGDDEVFNTPHLTAKTFLPYLLSEKMNVLVLYYASWCIFSHSTVTLFTSLAYKLRHFGQLKFVQIDASQNDLPNEYAVENLPTVVLYPQGGSNKRVVYPLEIALNQKNLISFLLHHCDLDTRLMLAIGLCNNAQCRHRNAVVVLRKIALYRGKLLRLLAIGRQRAAESSLIIWKIYSQLTLAKRRLLNVHRALFLAN